MALSDNLRKRRIEKGLTMEQLADKVGIAFQQINKYENNLSKPQPETFVLIANALGTTCEELVKGE
jgi:transcriptional regulator with XRE-family HTH domain